MPPKRARAAANSASGPQAPKRTRGAPRRDQRTRRDSRQEVDNGANEQLNDNEVPPTHIPTDEDRDVSPGHLAPLPTSTAAQVQEDMVNNQQLRQRHLTSTTPLASSTTWRVSNDQFESIESAVDPTTRLVDVIERTLNAVRDTSLGDGNVRLVNRLTTAKDLPGFSGDSLEWLNFKKSYESSTELGQYSASENIRRLNDALKGKARDVVATLLATSLDTAEIMSTLELHYGNKRAIAEKIVWDLKGLPDIESGKISLTQFASKLKSATTAFKTLNLTGYLHSPDLIRFIGSKLPSALKYAYNRYAATASAEKSELEKLGEFLYTEAQLAATGGVFDLDVIDTPMVQKSNHIRKNMRDVRFGNVYTTQCANENRDRERVQANRFKYRKCFLCSKENHRLSECSLFANEPIENRWMIVKKQKLCFNCLKFGHASNVCKNIKCPFCGKSHHSLLHRKNYRRDDTLLIDQQKNCNDKSGAEHVSVASGSGESQI